MGFLWEIRDEEILRFRCGVGHAYTAESMLAGKLEALEEGAEMSRRLTREARASGHEHAAARFEERAERTEEQAALIRQALASSAADAV